MKGIDEMLYKGFEYITLNDSYEVFDYGKLSNTKISLASGTGIENPDQRAKQKIDEIIETLGIKLEC